MKRIGVSGTNRTGKTTLIDSLVRALPDKNCEVISLGQLCAQSPYPMFKDQSLDGSQWMIDTVSEILGKKSSCDLQIFDRTPVDIMAFTAYIGYRDRDDAAKEVCQQAENLLQYFGRIFVLKSSEDWPQGEPPIPDELGFALLVQHFLTSQIKLRSISCEVLPWNFDNRLDVLIRAAK